MDKIMIHKNDRVYVMDWFDDNQKFQEGDVIEFEMPSFCSGDYVAKIFIDNDGDPYIDKNQNHVGGCRDYHYITKKQIDKDMFDLMKTFIEEESPTTLPIKEVSNIKLKDTDDEDGRAGEHYIVECILCGKGPTINFETISKQCCLVNIKEFKNWVKSEDKVKWL
jgi:hypothetical protein